MSSSSSSFFFFEGRGGGGGESLVHLLVCPQGECVPRSSRIDLEFDLAHALFPRADKIQSCKNVVAYTGYAYAVIGLSGVFF